MLHRTVEYDVKEVEPGLWRWNIYPGNRTVRGPVKFRSRELAVEASMAKSTTGSSGRGDRRRDIRQKASSG
ncbi:hypothetical protein [Tardiphaga robiniae]|uniref:hypothetical protein n=1 Tax=Tardiphaga robiniae TaxID=943830 RepID=UPI00111219C9|nr:hypothetical protein [Tardiphaga robiniae]